MKIVRGRFFSNPVTKFLALAIVLIFSTVVLLPVRAQLPTGVSYVDGTTFLEKLLEDSNSWSDYSCVTELHNFKPHANTVTHSKFFYKKGPRVRIEVVGGGLKHGTVLLRDLDGKYSGRGGFWLGGIQMKFEPDSHMLKLPGGYNALKADFPETFAELKDDLAKGYTCKVTAEPVDDPQIGKKTMILELYDPANFLSERVFLSADEEHLPMRWDSLNGGELKSTTWFRNLKINVGLEDKLFRL